MKEMAHLGWGFGSTGWGLGSLGSRGLGSDGGFGSLKGGRLAVMFTATRAGRRTIVIGVWWLVGCENGEVWWSVE
jgi:hypothetical protein